MTIPIRRRAKDASPDAFLFITQFSPLLIFPSAKTRQEKSRHKEFSLFVFSSSIKSLFFSFFSLSWNDSELIGYTESNWVFLGQLFGALSLSALLLFLWGTSLSKFMRRISFIDMNLAQWTLDYRGINRLFWLSRHIGPRKFPKWPFLWGLRRIQLLNYALKDWPDALTYFITRWSVLSTQIRKFLQARGAGFHQRSLEFFGCLWLILWQPMKYPAPF